MDDLKEFISCMKQWRKELIRKAMAGGRPSQEALAEIVLHHQAIEAGVAAIEEDKGVRARLPSARKQGG